MPDILYLPGKQVVDDRHGIAAINKVFRDVRPDEAGTAGDEVVHDSVQLFQGNSKFVGDAENYKNIP